MDSTNGDVHLLILSGGFEETLSCMNSSSWWSPKTETAEDTVINKQIKSTDSRNINAATTCDKLTTARIQLNIRLVVICIAWKI